MKIIILSRPHTNLLNTDVQPELCTLKERLMYTTNMQIRSDTLLKTLVLMKLIVKAGLALIYNESFGSQRTP